jgi:hypothetical protein
VSSEIFMLQLNHLVLAFVSGVASFETKWCLDMLDDSLGLSCPF